ncbi:pimeloyl-ACP methyl ester carboxylesterase [Bacillus oleivorans]|uniref:Pimeloyl-ACP methyl ester carboxylesterase n=1 Tax=Bacillus oleivorans TaxID=1448271 RepID=A0A285CN29_9BACI|nr:alpha/beta hydrolase [Bacillus oleivorans]SNX68403.1 pimeloyl-ACP methyl ester carboxylesterase [Bacillus oleivorans]
MQFIEFKDIQLAYYDKGKGTPIIMLHPPGFGYKVFYRQFPLSQQFRLIIPDLSGHGNSGTYTTTPTIDDYVEEIKALIDHLGLKSIYLFGYSSGGSVAQAFAIKYQHIVKGLILSGAYPKVQSIIFNIEHRLGIMLAKRNPKLLSKLLSKTHGLDYHSTTEVYWYSRKTHPLVWANFYKQALNYNCISELNKLKIPILLLYGTVADPINKHNRIYQKYLNPKIKFINRGTHLLPIYFAEELNLQILNFIKKSDQVST